MHRGSNFIDMNGRTSQSLGACLYPLFVVVLLCVLFLGKKLKEKNPEIKQLDVSVVSHVHLSPSRPPAGNCNIHKPIGGNVILELQHTVNSGEVIKWTHGGRILIELNGKRKLNHNKSNNIDLLENGSLKLTKLTEAEGGSYKPEVFQDGIAVGGLKTIDLCLLGE